MLQWFGGCGWSESKKSILLARIFLGLVLEAPKVHTAIKDFLFGGFRMPCCNGLGDALHIPL